MPQDERAVIRSIYLPSTTREHAAARFYFKQALFITGRVLRLISPRPEIGRECLQIAVCENARRNEWFRFEIRCDSVEQIGKRSFRGHLHEMPLDNCFDLPKIDEDINCHFLHVWSSFNFNSRTGCAATSLHHPRGEFAQSGLAKLFDVRFIEY